MAAIKSKNTKPEILVRSLVHRLGYRFRLHVRDLPGKPDMVLPRYSAVIFIHGCYWHMHKCRFGKVKPTTNAKFWQEKRISNLERDKRNIRALRRMGWRVLVIWECKTRDKTKLATRIQRFLSK